MEASSGAGPAEQAANGLAMRLRVTLLLGLGLLLSWLGATPSLGWSSWKGLSTLWIASGPWHLAVLLLVLGLAAVALEVRLGSLPLLALWGLPGMLQTALLGRAWPELSALGLALALLFQSFRQREALPWKVWLPLLLGLAFSLTLLQAPWLALGLTVGTVLGLSLRPQSEAMAWLGIVSGVALGFAWLS